MSINKITSREAWSLSNKIADKAFNHLIEPLEAKQNDCGRRAYEMLLEGIGGEQVLRKLVAYDVVRSSKSISIDVGSDSGKSHVNYMVENNTLFSTGLYENPVVVNGALKDEIDDLNEELGKLNTKKWSLHNTLDKQMTGKSAKAIIKAWPEAEGIINDYFGASCDGTLTTPLEALLAKFLPMLPAPQAA